MEMIEQLKDNIQRYSEGKLNLREQIALSEQLADPENDTTEQILNDDWKSELESDTNPDRNLQPILDRVHHQIRLNEGQKMIRLNWWQAFQRIAAILIVPLVFSFLAYFYIHSNQPVPEVAAISYAEIQCPLGVRTKFQLPDGSTGFLNSGSRLKYPVQFTNQRSVELSGEAFFDVVHNKEIPFHVNTRNLDIMVLGTTFDVIANEGENIEEIVLQTGKVDVSTKKGEQLAIMVPNEQLILNTEKQTVEKRQVEASQYTSWKEGQMVFRNENLQQVARRLSRWYNAEVVVDNRLLDGFTFHATFIDEPLDEVLKLISLVAPISYKEEKRTSDKEGTFQKRKIFLRINQSKIKQFR